MIGDRTTLSELFSFTAAIPPPRGRDILSQALAQHFNSLVCTPGFLEVIADQHIDGIANGWILCLFQHIPEYLYSAGLLATLFVYFLHFLQLKYCRFLSMGTYLVV